MVFNSEFKVGDKVKLTDTAAAILGKHESYEIADIYSDGFGSVALKAAGGYGYGFQYLELDGGEANQ